MTELIGALIIVFGAGFYFGYNKGVAETEDRWSEAVTKGEYYRKHGQV